MMSYETISSSSPSNVRLLLVTANTGSIFEKPELLSTWLAEFANLIRQYPSDFIALHCQEVGGKDYEKYMHTLGAFLKDLVQLPEISTDFSRHRLYFDSDYSSQKTFTALGCAYFIRDNLPIQQWNFAASSFQPVVNCQIFAGDVVNAQTLRKEKYPREFFPEAKWSRKGFSQTRWLINDFTFDLLNIHLFHDASNILAAEQSPSLYSKCRKKALQFTLQSLSLDPSNKPVPYVIFGDFNFRLDAHGLVEFIAQKRLDLIDKIKEDESDETAKIIIRNESNKPRLTIEKKGFNLHDDHDAFFNNRTEQARLFDFESSSFTDQLFEYEKTFPPSYPYSEEHHEARSYLRARCPAWCDRILLSHLFKESVDTEVNRPTYDLMGRDVCVGDHKPVYLSLTIHLLPGASNHVQQSQILTLSPSTKSPTTDDPTPSNLSLHDGSSPTEPLATHRSHLDYKNLVSKTASFSPGTTTTSTTTYDPEDHRRTVLTRYVFQANIQQTLSRWMRETPV